MWNITRLRIYFTCILSVQIILIGFYDCPNPEPDNAYKMSEY